METAIANETGLPLVSIVLPIRNEARFIERSLNSVLEQTYPADRLEVIVADGMSTDGTREIVQRFQSEYSNVRLIDNPGRIVPTGLNAALAQSRGQIIVRVDGHAEIEKEYTERCVEHLQRDGVDGVGGPLETIGENGLSKVIAVAMSSPFGVGNSAFRTLKNRTMLVDTVAFPAYTRSAITRAGPYDEELVRDQDDDYNYRLRKLGFRLLLAADVRARYYSRSSFRSLWRQYFQYGYFKVRVMQKQPRQMRPRQFVPAVFVLALIISCLLVPFSSLGWWGFCLVTGAYLLANILASIITARKERCSMPLLLPVAFATLHLSYGLGFLAGLIRFRRRWRS